MKATTMCNPGGRFGFGGLDLKRTLALALVALAPAAWSGPAIGAGSATVRLAGASEPEVDLALGDFLAGNVALDRGELEAASDHFARTLARHPDDQDLLRQVFALAVARGDFEAALEHARSMDEKGEAGDEMHVLLALEAARDGDYAEARDGFSELRPNGVAALAVPFLDAWALFGAGGPDALEQARSRLDDASSLSPLDQYHEAALLLLAERPGEAVTMLEEVLPEEGPAPARMALTKASALADEGKIEAARQFIADQLAHGHEAPLLDAALADLEQGRVPKPAIGGPAAGMADALFGIAQALQQERGGMQAILYARLATFVEPGMAEAAVLIGDVLAEQENYDGAIAAYGGVPEASPFHAAARLRVAQALHAAGREEEAYELLQELAEDQPNSLDALIQLGDLLRRDEHYLRAEQAYSRAVERIGSPEPEHWTLFYARGITYERTKRWTEAEEDFLFALDLQPEQPFVLNYLGYSWVDMGLNLDRAQDMLVRAVELRPSDGFIVDSLGWVQYRLGRFEDAVETLERAVELEPGDPVINDHLGDAYWRVGRQREARFQWERALTLEPEDDEIPKIERKLERGLPPADPIPSQERDGQRI